ncbi:DUF4234 domain-containing protein [Culicoidibacter larvae]|uniref:DUF4234 domain-containing protein n=1 Tax=Culicoidibacter larvae TaxID=2579976 RepID=A0A5R8QHY5_9FIRM|nr:DUF4234 domain-containing protein [Culicoidibacter larvae]TLG77414.1 DUF4234 domain-containing protein [Culicoidibacter larvae]
MGNLAMNKKSIAAVIILSIVTCGIYYFIWMASTTNQLKMYNEDYNGTSGGMVVLLSIITCGIYGMYWWYQIAKKVTLAQQKAGMPTNDNSILYLILAIFGFGIIGSAILQSDLNNLWDYASMNTANNNPYAQ